MPFGIYTHRCPHSQNRAAEIILKYYFLEYINAGKAKRRLQCRLVYTRTNATMNIENRREYFSETYKSIETIRGSFIEVVFENCTFEHCNFSDSRFYKCKFVDCVFTGSNLSNCNVDFSKFLEVTFNESKLVGIDWTKADWPRFNFTSPLKFNNCIINDSSFFGLALSELVVEYCKAHDVDFRHGNFTKANFRYTDFTNSLFMKTNIQQADFSEAENYDIDIFNNEIKSARFSRLEAVRLLNCLAIDLVD